LFIIKSNNKAEEQKIAREDVRRVKSSEGAAVRVPADEVKQSLRRRASSYSALSLRDSILDNV